MWYFHTMLGVRCRVYVYLYVCYNVIVMIIKALVSTKKQGQIACHSKTLSRTYYLWIKWKTTVFEGYKKYAAPTPVYNMIPNGSIFGISVQGTLLLSLSFFF